MLQVRIKFALKFFNLGWFSISCLLALIIYELGPGDKDLNLILACNKYTKIKEMWIQSC